jgi:hypothetical protein
MPTAILVKSSGFQRIGRDVAGLALGGARSIAHFAQHLLLALRESRFEQAQRHIDNLRHLVSAANEMTNLRSRPRCGGSGDREPARAHRPPEARRKPSHAA